MVEHEHNMDELIRKKFENFTPEPPASLWEQIRSHIGGQPPSAPIISVILPVLTGIALMIAFIFLYHNPSDPEYAQQPEKTGSNLSSGERSGTWFAAYEASAEKPEYIESQAIITTLHEETTRRIPVRAPFNSEPPALALPETAHQQAYASEPAKIPASDIVESAQFERFSSYDKIGNLKAEPIDQRSDYPAYFEANPRTVPGREDYFTKKQLDWSLGLYFNPEYTFNSGLDDNHAKSLSFGIMPTLSFSRIFLQGGLNIRVTNDIGNYAISYNRYLGKYEDVYLVTFDSTENGIIPNYYTQTVEVYDTIDHYTVSETKARYTYLDIPLYIGYRQSFDRFSWFVKGGPSISFLAGRNIPEASYPDEQVKIVNVDRQIPARSTVNIQVAASAGFDIRLTPGLSFSIEPTFRYFMTPEINDQNVPARHPYSFGLRTGLIYHFKK